MSQIQPQKSQNYKDSGVDIEAGAALVERIKPLAKQTQRPGTMTGIGGFGALFDLKAAGFQDPVLVASTDGVGTKIKVAIEAGTHKQIGRDLVGICVNDIVAQGAEPLFFLDYFASGKLNVDQATDIISGIAEACADIKCALIGGETAEMPGLYARGDYDLAGFAVGAVERDKIIDGRTIVEGDAVLGISSDGVHANGYSLVRKVVEISKLSYSDVAPFSNNQTLGEALSTPTRLYHKSLGPVGKNHILKGIAHITGGGLIENVPRILPDGLAIELDAATWPLPPVFRWLKETGHINALEMARTFNCGLGMVIACAQKEAPSLQAALKDCGETVYNIGRVVRQTGDSSLSILNLEDAWETHSN